MVSTLDTFEHGEPTKSDVAQALVERWEMDAYTSHYEVVVAIGRGAEDAYVMVDAKRELYAGGEATRRTWRLMKYADRGGVITPDMVMSLFSVDALVAERLSVLIASALRRPYAVRYSDDLEVTPD